MIFSLINGCTLVCHSGDGVTGGAPGVGLYWSLLGGVVGISSLPIFLFLPSVVLKKADGTSA